MSEKQLRKGDKVELTITSLAPGGEGVSKDLGQPIFVPRVAVGDRVLVEIFDSRKGFARGRAIEILVASPDRIDPPCKLFKVCGGCQWQHLSYESQLRAKEEILKQSLMHMGGMTSYVVQETIGSDRQFHYRNKVQFPVRQPQGSTRILAGYYEQDSHRLVNIKHCPVQPQALDEMLAAAKQCCERFGISAYNEKTGKGLLRFINARVNEEADQILVTLVVNSGKSTMPEALVQAAQDIAKTMPNIVGVCANFNTSPGNRILGNETICLTGKPYVEERLKASRADAPARLQQGLVFRLSADSFFQINTSQAVKLFERLRDIIDQFCHDTKITPKSITLIDAYAGVGAIALWLAPIAGKVIAIEENAASVEDGKLNLQINAIDNVEFRPGTVEKVLPALFNQGVRPQIVVLDPPRKGCSLSTLEAVVKLAPDMIAYVSCNPVTLARDLKILHSTQAVSDKDQSEAVFGYKTEKVLAIDLFPQTFHVESVAVLYRRLLNGQTINVEEAGNCQGDSAGRPDGQSRQNNLG
jgi:23S rRNA (uracil1939-C5)-methyltransferase